MKKILVIDDAEFILESTSTLLQFEGYEVYTAPDGQAGVELAFDIIPDLILCDISMPKLDGYAVLKAVRENRALATVPFVFLTAFTEKINMRAGMSKGADDYIVKPFTRDELIASINSQWKKFQLIEERVQKKVNEVGKNVSYALPHEFRTALNEVIGSAKFLISGADTVSQDEIRDTAKDIVESANRLLKITENFLIYVSIESFASNPERKQLLRECITEEPIGIIQDVSNVIAHKFFRFDDLIIEDKTLNEADSKSTVPLLEISSESFSKLITELLDNAFRFSVPGQKVKIIQERDNNHYIVKIIDEGRGMTQEQIKDISALTQFDRPMYEQQGVGLGLIVAKKIVEVHDGDFQVDSIEGKGTTITFFLHFHNS